jgi:hypothetical protein
MKREKDIIEYMNRIVGDLNTSKFMSPDESENIGLIFSITVAKNNLNNGCYSHTIFSIDKDQKLKKYFLNKYEDSRTIKQP